MTIRDITFLTEVMDTIASFKDSKGSPPDKILGSIISQRKTAMRNPSLQVRKALKNGLESGLLKEVNGKFKLGLGSKEYAVLRNFRMLEKKGLPFRELRRRGGRRRRRRRRRGGRRRGSQFYDDDTVEIDSKGPKDSSFLKMPRSSTVPIMELRRRGRSRRRRKRRGRRRSNVLNDDDTMAELMDRSRRRRSRKRRRRRRGRRRILVEEEVVKSVGPKEISRVSSEEKPKTAKSGHVESRNPLQKRDLVTEPEENRINGNVSEHCIHSYHHDDGHYGHPPHPGHFGREYYD